MASHILPSKTSWHPSYVEAVLHETQCPASRSTADPIVNQRNAHISRSKTMFQTSEARQRGNTRHSAKQCFSRWPFTFFLPRPPGTLAISRQSPIKRSVRKVPALLTQSSIRGMLTSQDQKKCSRHPKRGCGEILHILQQNAFQDGLTLFIFQHLLAP